jgi:Spaetzle
LDDTNNSTSSAFSYSSFLAPHYRRRRQTADALVELPFNDKFHKENVQNMFLEQIGARSRTKRQNTDVRALCTSRSFFVDPQAALNVNGDWKYVVNSNTQTRQMVKAEVCA